MHVMHIRFGSIGTRAILIDITYRSRERCPNLHASLATWSILRTNASPSPVSDKHEDE